MFSRFTKSLIIIKIGFLFLFIFNNLTILSQSTFGYCYDIPESPNSYESAPKALIRYDDSSYVGIISDYYGTHILFMSNEKGKLLWIKKLNLITNNYFYDIKVLSDGSIAILFSGNSIFMKSILLKLNKNGGTIWGRKLFDLYNLIAPTQNGGMVLSGTGAIKIYSLDSAGNSKSYNQLNYLKNQIQAIATDSNYISTFISVNMNYGVGTPFTIGNFDSSGIISNTRSYSFYGYVMAASFVKLIKKNNGGFYALFCSPTPSPNILLVSFNKNREILWSEKITLPNLVLNTFPTPDIAPTANGGCIIISEFQMPAINYTLYSPIFIQLDSNGIVLSSKTIEDTANVHWINSKIYTIVPANTPNHFMAAGLGNRMYFQPSWQQIYSDLYLYRFDLNMQGFCDTTSIKVQTQKLSYILDNVYFYTHKPNHFLKQNYYFSSHDISSHSYDICTYTLIDSINTGLFYHKNENETINVFPNPVHDIIYIETKERVNFNYKVYNIMGQCVLQGNNISNKIFVSGLKSGYYLLVIETKNKEYRKKISIIN